MATVGIVTGAGRGMGLACAPRVAALVDTLVLVDRDEVTVTAAAKELTASGPGAPAEPFVCAALRGQSPGPTPDP
jgi:NAD(P)-dependent dehydrogenase (short-subunit alcohol dehydrogenase family)